MKNIGLLLILLTLNSCAIYSFKSNNEKITSKITKNKTPIKIGIRFSSNGNEKNDEDKFRKEFTNQLVLKKINFVIDELEKSKDEGLYINLDVKYYNDEKFISWKMLAWAGSAFLTFGLIPVKFVSYYEVDAKVFLQGKIKDSFHTKVGFDSWVDTLFILAGPFTESRHDVNKKVFENLANQVLTKVEGIK